MLFFGYKFSLAYSFFLCEGKNEQKNAEEDVTKFILNLKGDRMLIVRYLLIIHNNRGSHICVVYVN
jgi:hypothetical protein